MVNYRQADGDLAALLCALSFATGVGFGGHMEHGLGSASLGLEIADALTLASEECEAVFYGALLKDVACTACSAGIAAFIPDDEQVSLSDVILIDPSRFSDMIGWLSKYFRLDAGFPGRVAKLLSFLVQCGPVARETMRSHCEVAELFARQLGFPDYVQRTLRFQWERWDGKGMAYGLKGLAIPRTARILHFAQVLELMYRFGGPAATHAIAQEKRGTRFDPEIVDVFLALTQRADFWSTFEEQSTQEALLARRPSTMADCAHEDQTERVCEALADFIDLKTRETWHHSRIVAEVAVGIGTCLGLETRELIKLRCAALVHDIGKVAVPTAILAKGDQRSSSERETYRLHPYYTQRILERVDALRDLAQGAAAHHEWVNGQGYHRQLCGEQIPHHGRILAVANTYAWFLQRQGDQKDPAEVLRTMHSLVGSQFDRVCYDALVASVTGADGLGSVSRRSGKASHTAPCPGDRYPQAGLLTEREVEVLGLLAQGHNTPQIARMLDISRKTVEHHLGHIYAKIGVTCRTAAVVYAVQQGLV
jgi:HD-GYP domain-containing protein (c-di-GMP phosphodiesterase class II)/DNA-binding CsgD family transcriptional regulator